jgi:hypothetical protein
MASDMTSTVVVSIIIVLAIIVFYLYVVVGPEHSTNRSHNVYAAKMGSAHYVPPCPAGGKCNTGNANSGLVRKKR